MTEAVCPPPDLSAAPGLPLSVELSLSRPAVLPHVAEDEPLHVLIRLRCTGSPDPAPGEAQSGSPHQVIRSSGHQVINRMPVHLGLVLDASGSMHRIVLESEEQERWRQMARERGDLKWGRVDGREGWLWSGQTLAELQARQRTPMQAAVHALVRAGERMQPDDALTVIAFADRAQQLVVAGHPDRAGRIRAAVAALSQGVDEQHLGSGTRLAEALRLALEEMREGTGGGGVGRLLLISDGLVEDRVAARAGVERIADAGISLSCIGVGDQFDEELLMWAADTTRGRFRYAPAADALEAAVAEELELLETVVTRQLALTLRPLTGTLFRDLCQVTPDLSAFQRLETDGAVYHFSLGDRSHRREALFLAELSLPPLPRGEHPVLAVQLRGECADGSPLTLPVTEAAVRVTFDLLATEADAAVLDAVAACHAYRAERRAQRALRRGQLGEATRLLRNTRQIVERLGHADLAAEMEAHADGLDAGLSPSAERSKRIQADTRRLMR